MNERKKEGNELWQSREKASSETQGQIVGARERLNGWKKMARGKVPFFSARLVFPLPPLSAPWVSEDGEKVANEGDYTAPPSSDNALSLLRTAICYRTLYPPRGYKR